MPITTELILARHGEATCNVDRVVGGPRTCTGLTQGGQQQVQLLAERLAADAPFDALYTSPRTRTRETAQIIGDRLDMPPRVDPELQGLDQGSADGLPWIDVKTDFGGRPQSKPHLTIAPGAEPWNSCLARTGAALNRILAKHQNQRILIAGHGETIEASFAYFLGLALTEDERAGYVTDHACLTRWQLHTNRFGNTVWMLGEHNDTRHLDTRAAP